MNEEELTRIRSAFYTFAQAVSEQMQHFIDVVTPVMGQLYNAMYSKYLEEGAVYGESHEGMMRWMDDLAEIRRHEQSIEEIRQRHWFIADTKRMIQKSKANQQER